ALALLVKSRAQEEGLRKLFGKGQFWEDYDYKAMRADEPADIPSGATKAGIRRLQARRALGRNAA
ncbi:MAG TPA: hypothetical protein VLI45_07875, partial [Acidobacteriaceae bacterium]|nr:hypothetical protein [Acidobacteriaceae bacterium]